MSETEPRTPRPAGAFHVGDWRADPPLNRLTSGATVRRIRPQLMDVLVSLASHHERVVSKEMLLAEVWPGRFIAEPGLVRCIAELRQELGDDPHAPKYIETIAKRGYRLVAPVRWIDDSSPRDGSAAGPPRGEATVPRERLRWWTPRRAVIVGLGAVASVVLVVMAAGGPPLSRQDTVVLAFENATGDAVFDEALPLALAIELEQSPYLRVLPAARARDTLGLMKRPPDTPIARALGLEVCERAGATAVILGSVSALGGTYAVGLEAIACATGEPIARRQMEVNGKDAVLGGLSEVAACGEALETLTRVYPSLPVPHHRLAAQHLTTGRYDDAIAEARAHAQLAPKSALAITQLAWALLLSGRLDEALQTVDSGIALGVDDEGLHGVGLHIGFLTGEASLLAREREWGAGHPQSAMFMLEAEAEYAVWRGQLERALAFLDRFQIWLTERTATYYAATVRLRMARYEALCGASADAVARMERELAADAEPGLRVEALKVTVSAGDLARTAALLDELDRAGRIDESRRAYDAFLAGWKDADPGLPLLAQARRERSALE